MEKRFEPSKHEQRIYEFWEKHKLFTTKSGKPYTILMPPPNANASLHAGHGMYVVDDIMIRYKRLLGYAPLWIPGLDHAGFETQYVYEKHLRKQGKSRLDFPREVLYQNIFKFVQENSGLIYQQFRRLGFLADWERSVFTLDKPVLTQVFNTFKKMESEGLVYRDDYIVNYCVSCGTSLAELEVKHIERTDPLYYIKYGPFTLATVRPETKFGDTAVAVNPNDQRYKQWIGKLIEVEGLLGKFKLKVVADEAVDKDFGTGVVKVTPAHDPVDFEIGKRHSLEVKQVINLEGRLNELAGPYAGLRVKQARLKVVEELKRRKLIDKIDENYTHSVGVCYKCSSDLEPTIIPNWFIKVGPLKQPVIDAVEKNKLRFFPKRYKKHMLDWLAVMRDWPISRQIVWGIRIPAWYNVDKNPELYVVFLDKTEKMVSGKIGKLLQDYSLSEIAQGLQKLIAPKNAEYVVSYHKPKGNFLQETDTFDTWFSSGQWPLVTLRKEEYKTRFPTDMMGTLADILKFWVSRMIMFSLYERGEVPFRDVYLWSMVADAKGVKMSKSKGNVINPIDLVDKYGADAFRAALLFGTSQGGKVNLSEDKVRAMRNFANKLWNIGRFIKMHLQDTNSNIEDLANSSNKIIKELFKEGQLLEKRVRRLFDEYKLSQALEDLYEFIWHRFADYYLEALKQELKNGNIESIQALKQEFLRSLRLLHPFMPFVTEAIYKEFKGQEASLLVAT